MKAEIVLTGTELLLGEIVDTNSIMVAQMLHEIGIDVVYKTTVGDNEERITDVLKLALGRVDVVIISGGLGPTVDDVTRQAAAKATGKRLIYNEEFEAQIAARFKSFGRPMKENNKRQAWMPEGAIPVENPVGTAPCFIVEHEEGIIICLPGVPRELKHQMTEAIIPYLKEKVGQLQLIKIRTIRTCGVGESDVDREIDDLMRLSNPTVGLRAHIGQVDIRIAAKANTEAEASVLIEPIEADIRQRLGDVIFGVNQETLGDVVAQGLAQNHLGLTLVDTLTDAALVKAICEHTQPSHPVQEQIFETPKAVLSAFKLERSDETNEMYSLNIAQALSQEEMVGLCILGPITLAEDKTVSYLALAHGDYTKVRQFPYRYDPETNQRWLTIQGLDMVRRYLIGD